MKKHRKRRANRVHRFEKMIAQFTKETDSDEKKRLHIYLAKLWAFGRVSHNHKYIGSNKQKVRWKKL